MERHVNYSASKTLPKYISNEEISNMLDKAKKEGKKFSYRNYIILMTLSRTGIRAKELTNIRKRDIVDNVLTVRMGKGKKDRVIPLENEISGLLGLYTDNMTPRDKIFTISVRQVRNIVYKYAPGGLDVHPHTLRHSFAIHCLKSGMNIRSLQKILGHSSLNTTQVYLDVIGKDVIDDFGKVVW